MKASKEHSINRAFETPNQLIIALQNYSLFRSAPIGSRIANHLIQIGNGASEAGSRDVLFSPPANRTLYIYIYIYIYIYSVWFGYDLKKVIIILFSKGCIKLIISDSKDISISTLKNTVYFKILFIKKSWKKSHSLQKY